MALGTGTHWEGPLLGSDKAQGGLCEEVPADIQSRRHRSALFYDFIDANDDATLAVTTLTAGTAVIVGPTTNGILRLTTGAVADQGLGSVQFSLDAAAYLSASTTDSSDGLPNRLISFGCRASLADWSDNDWFIGLAGTDTTLMASTGALTTVGFDNGVGFRHLVADGNDLGFVSAGAAVANIEVTLFSAAQVPRVAPANAGVDAVFHEFGITIDGTQNIAFYINGVLRHRRRMANALAAAMTPSLTLISGTGVANTMDVDYLWTSQTR